MDHRANLARNETDHLAQRLGWPRMSEYPKESTCGHLGIYGRDSWSTRLRPVLGSRRTHLRCTSRYAIRIVAAVNHWQLAVQSHQQNHPEAQHYCQDAALLDPRRLPPFDVLLASPECRGHTHARGKDRPHHDASRATAWCVVNVAEVTKPHYLVVENVPEFREWILYPLWRSALESLG